jgi:hypothetical protein
VDYGRGELAEDGSGEKEDGKGNMIEIHFMDI